MLRYGSDKPDLRYGLEIADVTRGSSRGSDFGVFRSAVDAGGAVRALACPGAAVLTRKDLDELKAFAREWGGKGLAYLLLEEGGELRSPIAKFLSEAEIAAIREPRPAPAPGDAIFLAADSADDRRARARRAAAAPRASLRADRPTTPGSSASSSTSRSSTGRGRGALGGRAPHVHGAEARSTRSCSRPIRAPSSRRPTTWSSTATRWRRGSIRIHRADLQERIFRRRRLPARRRRGALRLPAARAALRRAAARRHRARPRPHRRCCSPAPTTSAT